MENEDMTEEKEMPMTKQGQPQFIPWKFYKHIL